MLENVEVGAMGWACEAFYPEDMPSEWQLEYYANHFSAVLVPSTQWPDWTEAQWQDFLESSDTLRWVGFGLKTVPTEVQAACLDAALMTLSERGQAVGVFSHVSLPRLLEKWPVTWFDRPEVESIWRWRHLSGAPAGWVDTLPDDTKAMRVLLEDFAQSLPDESVGAPFIVKDGCANMRGLKQFKQLAELLGL